MLQLRADSRDPVPVESTRALPSVEGRELKSALVQALIAVADGLHLVDLDPADDAQSNIDRDARFIDNAAAHTQPRLRIWRNRRCVVASRSQARSPHFDAAQALSLAAGWPVAVRRSGGTAVVHGPGVLNISLIRGYPPAGKAPGVVKAYRELLDLLIRAMSCLDVHCDYGAVPGACCDGSYNLRWQGRKLAGTAGFITRRGGAPLSVFHAAITVDDTVDEGLAAIERFERALGKTGHYSRQAHVSVADILSPATSSAFRPAAAQVSRSSP